MAMLFVGHMLKLAYYADFIWKFDVGADGERPTFTFDLGEISEEIEVDTPITPPTVSPDVSLWNPSSMTSSLATSFDQFETRDMEAGIYVAWEDSFQKHTHDRIPVQLPSSAISTPIVGNPTTDQENRFLQQILSEVVPQICGTSYPLSISECRPRQMFKSVYQRFLFTKPLKDIGPTL
jgi:hypothetical protein